MKKLKRYTKEQALEIINNDEALKNDLEELKPYNETGDINHGFENGNFFNLSDEKTNTAYKDKIVIEWLDSGYKDDEFNFEAHCHEVVTDSLEEAIVLLKDIEDANGDIEA
jgi:hypothetical protein